MDSSPITVAIQNDKGYTITPIDNSVTMSVKGNTVYLTVDLKTAFQFQLKVTP